MEHDWQALLNPDIKHFITAHQNDDIRALALKKPPNPKWPYPLILDQIKARQKATTKIPAWHNETDIIFPPNDTLEQASSQATATYKSSLFNGKNFLDLTGGAGIDSWAMLKNFENAIIIDCDINAATRIEHNMKILTKKPVLVKNTTAEDFTKTMTPLDLAIIDPQRRNQSRKGLYRLEDCSPNIISLIPQIKADTILLKTSPMLDIDQAIAKLGCVSGVHVVEWNGECKELLFVIKPDTKTKNIHITAVNLDDKGHPLNTLTFTQEQEKIAPLSLSPPLRYLYEPSPAFMKAGAYNTLAQTYKMFKLHAHTHLYTSDHLIDNFPGRGFKIIKTYPVQAKTLPFKKANLTIRNFPQDTASLRKKLKIKEGGTDYLFACTIMDAQTLKNKYAILHCDKKMI